MYYNFIILLNFIPKFHCTLVFFVDMPSFCLHDKRSIFSRGQQPLVYIRSNDPFFGAHVSHRGINSHSTFQSVTGKPYLNIPPPVGTLGIFSRGFRESKSHRGIFDVAKSDERLRKPSKISLYGRPIGSVNIRECLTRAIVTRHFFLSEFVCYVDV